MANNIFLDRTILPVSGDATATPRYNLVQQDGTIVAQGVSLELVNQIMQTGTPLSAENLNKLISEDGGTIKGPFTIKNSTLYPRLKLRPSNEDSKAAGTVEASYSGEINLQAYDDESDNNNRRVLRLKARGEKASVGDAVELTDVVEGAYKNYRVYHEGVDGAQIRGKIGAASAEHSHSAGDIAAGSLPINRGGTGAGTAAAARTALGVTPGNIGAVSKNGDTMSGTLRTPYCLVAKDSWPGIGFANADGKSLAAVSISTDNGSNRLTLVQRATGATYQESYSLPARTENLTENKWHGILTSKNPVTVSQGGTGCKTEAELRTYLKKLLGLP